MGAHGDAMDRLGLRAKPPSPGGDMGAYSSKSGNKVALPAPMSTAQAMSIYVSIAPAEAGEGPEGGKFDDALDVMKKETKTKMKKNNLEREKFADEFDAFGKFLDFLEEAMDGRLREMEVKRWKLARLVEGEEARGREEADAVTVRRDAQREYEPQYVERRDGGARSQSQQPQPQQHRQHQRPQHLYNPRQESSKDEVEERRGRISGWNPWEVAQRHPANFHHNSDNNNNDSNYSHRDAIDTTNNTNHSNRTADRVDMDTTNGTNNATVSNNDNYAIYANYANITNVEGLQKTKIENQIDGQRIPEPHLPSARELGSRPPAPLQGPVSGDPNHAKSDQPVPSDHGAHHPHPATAASTAATLEGFVGSRLCFDLDVLRSSTGVDDRLRVNNVVVQDAAGGGGRGLRECLDGKRENMPVYKHGIKRA